MNDRSRPSDSTNETGSSPDRDELKRDGQSASDSRASESGEWRDGYGAYGVGPENIPRRGVSRRDPQVGRDRTPSRSGYGEQGFGAGEAPGASWGGGARGGYGGGQPGGIHGMRGGGWAAAGERFEQGRSARSHGAGGGDGGGHRNRHEHGSHDDAWATSEFAGRGEFGSTDSMGWSGAGSTVGGQPDRRERWEVPGPYSGLGPEGYRRSEEAIRDDVCERLTRHGELDARNISVRVEQGEVVLEGAVDSRRSKRMAEATAESVTGVRDVHNRLRIDENSFDRDRMEGRSGGRG